LFSESLRNFIFWRIRPLSTTLSRYFVAKYFTDRGLVGHGDPRHHDDQLKKGAAREDVLEELARRAKVDRTHIGSIGRAAIVASIDIIDPLLAGLDVETADLLKRPIASGPREEKAGIRGSC
jgi:hypothetical protein